MYSGWYLCNLEQKPSWLLDDLLLKLSWKYNQNGEQGSQMFGNWTLGNQMLVREINAKQACTLAFTVSDKVHIVIIIATDLSGVAFLIDINLWYNEHP